MEMVEEVEEEEVMGELEQGMEEKEEMEGVRWKNWRWRR